MIQVYSYTFSVCLGTFNELKCEVKNKANEVPEATILLKTEDVKDLGSTKLALGNVMKLDNNFCYDFFRITNVSVSGSTTTVEAKQINCKANVALCVNEQTAKRTTEYAVWQWCQQMYKATYPDYAESTWINFSNLEVQENPGVADRIQLRFRPFWICSGETELTEDSLYSVTNNSEPDDLLESVFDEQITFDMLGKTYEDAIKFFVDEVGLNVIYFSHMAIITTHTQKEFFEWFWQYGSEDVKNNMRLKNPKYYVTKDIYTLTEATGYSLKAEDNNFVAAIAGVFDKETTNRKKNVTRKVVDYTSGIPSYQYNTAYKTKYGEQQCLRFAQLNEYKTEVTWNRAINMKVQVYYVPVGRNAYQLYFYNEMSPVDDENPVSASNPIQCVLYDIVNKQCGNLEITAANTWQTQYATNGTTVIGSAKAVLQSEDSNKYDITLSIGNGFWKARSSKQDQSLISETVISAVVSTDGFLTDELKLYDPFGAEFGVVNILDYTESDSYEGGEATTYNIEHRVDNNVGIRGHVFLAHQEGYSTYDTNILTDIRRQAKTDVNSYKPEIDLQSLSVELLPQTIENVIFPLDNLRVWLHELETDATLQCSSITFDSTHQVYTAIETGYVRASLRDIKDNQTAVNRKIRQILDTVKTVVTT